jgi:hypothetical protein
MLRPFPVSTKMCVRRASFFPDVAEKQHFSADGTGLAGIPGSISRASHHFAPDFLIGCILGGESKNPPQRKGWADFRWLDSRRPIRPHRLDNQNIAFDRQASHYILG